MIRILEVRSHYNTKAKLDASFCHCIFVGQRDHHCTGANVLWHAPTCCQHATAAPDGSESNSQSKGRKLSEDEELILSRLWIDVTDRQALSLMRQLPREPTDQAAMNFADSPHVTFRGGSRGGDQLRQLRRDDMRFCGSSPADGIHLTGISVRRVRRGWLAADTA